VLPPLLAGFAAFADSRGAHGLARDALLAAVPFAAVGALVAFGDFIDARAEGRAGLQAFLSATIVALLVLSCAVRSSALHGVPPLGVSSLVAALGLFAIKAIVAGAPHVRRLAEFWPAKP
jgi:hypothetical protein